MAGEIGDLKAKYNSLLKSLAATIKNDSTDEFNTRVDEVISEVKALMKKNELEQ